MGEEGSSELSDPELSSFDDESNDEMDMVLKTNTLLYSFLSYRS